ncbi:putative Heterokaryon incompatibility domain-containing protein [Seiridium cardinale]|uniref:Heterokaryon incompatibility domain-containing protein n=1 Tax=Seiridium cardinale TaxID=138064 RepID=A0ABR2XDB8_9PEZI
MDHVLDRDSANTSADIPSECDFKGNSENSHHKLRELVTATGTAVSQAAAVAVAVAVACAATATSTAEGIPTSIANRVADFSLDGSSSSGYRPATRPDTERYYRAFEHLYKTRIMQWEGFRLHPEMMNVDWFHNIFAESHGRQFFITKRGYIGLANNGTEANDQVAVIKGGDVPVVLRKRQPTDDCEGTTWLGSRSPERKMETGSKAKIYGLVIEGYVHGLMKGEISSISGIQ